MEINVRVECESFVKNHENNKFRNLLATSSWMDDLQKTTWKARVGR